MLGGHLSENPYWPALCSVPPTLLTFRRCPSQRRFTYRVSFRPGLILTVPTYTLPHLTLIFHMLTSVDLVRKRTEQASVLPPPGLWLSKAPAASSAALFCPGLVQLLLAFPLAFSRKCVPLLPVFLVLILLLTVFEELLPPTPVPAEYPRPARFHLPPLMRGQRDGFADCPLELVLTSTSRGSGRLSLPGILVPKPQSCCRMVVEGPSCSLSGAIAPWYLRLPRLL